VLVSSADGVRHQAENRLSDRQTFEPSAEDLVNHCVNDIAGQGAKPLFFLDYFATGKLNARVAAAVVSGNRARLRTQ